MYIVCSGNLHMNYEDESMNYEDYKFKSTRIITGTYNVHIRYNAYRLTSGITIQADSHLIIP